MLFRRIGGCCPFCGNTDVFVIEGMVFEYQLNAKGELSSMNDDQYRITACCVNCAKQLYPIPNGRGGYDIYPSDVRKYSELTYGEEEYTDVSIMANKILPTMETESIRFAVYNGGNVIELEDDQKNPTVSEELLQLLQEEDEVPF